MNKQGIILGVIMIGLVFTINIQSGKAAELDLNLDIPSGFNDLQQPFSDFLDSATQISISQNSSTQSTFKTADQIQTSWDSSNQWFKEKTGLDILSALKVVGNILIFVMNLAITAISATIKGIEWLLSLIPGTN